ncbi:amidohydrolase family protein [Meridianimarinicoccus aquatilis]|uniref:Cytosine deaminase n=1 Tax=Meridianimarinicoccus aquatilis TaxID=2552766 RepID=A0A4R6B2M9_9RHOB|nr:amidohydrolase family protein [Fluviibacterium aquatile]TDL90502.1 cytosine deaminase [Fluviibacterium aquatile]
MTECIIEAGTILCGRGASGEAELRHDASIHVKDGVIAQIGPQACLTKGKGSLPRFGGSNMIAIPGLVNSHHHFGITPLMGGIPFAPLELWLPRFRAMRQIGPRLDTLYSAIEMLESGTTTVHHIHSGLVGGHEQWMDTTDTVLGAYGDIGMRAGYSFMMRDQNVFGYGPDADLLARLEGPLRDWVIEHLSASKTPPQDYMAFFREMRTRWHQREPNRVRMNLAPANLHWCSDDSLQMMFETARDVGANLHMHLVETERQAHFAQEKFGCSAVEHLRRLGCLGPDLTIGHGNWTSARDLEILADCACSVCHNASSGLRLGSGIAPVNAMVAQGIPVALGIDQSNIFDDRDMTAEMKLVWALHRDTGLFNDRLSAAQILQSATEHGAASVGYKGETGRLEPGMKADIVLIDKAKMERPFVDPRTPVADTLLHRLTKSAIKQVFVEGDMVVDDGKVTKINRAAVMAEIHDALSAPETPREAHARAMVDALVPHLEQDLRRAGHDARHRPYRFNAQPTE